MFARESAKAAQGAAQGGGHRCQAACGQAACGQKHGLRA
jgi:hypothetical protein